jgi:cytochrome b561
MLDVHALLAFVTAGLAVLHVGAALKHHLLDRDATLAHMLPGLRAHGETGPAPKNPGRLAILGLGLGLAGAALAASLYFVADRMSAPASAPPSTFEVTETAPPTEPGATETAPLAPTPSSAPATWRVDAGASSIRFGYTYEDESGATPFNGRFTRWRADIRFDPNDLEQSSAVVRIETASASTGVAMHDGALPGGEWFDSANSPTATFRTTRIRARGDGYEARGDLTIRGRTRSVDLPFTLTISGDRATMDGRTTIDRRDFDVGEGSGDELISREIELTIHVEAARAP